MEAAQQEQPEESGDTAGAEKTEPVAEENTLAAKSGPVALEKDADGKRHCPKCGREFRVVDGGAVRVVNGKVDMEVLNKCFANAAGGEIELGQYVDAEGKTYENYLLIALEPINFADWLK